MKFQLRSFILASVLATSSTVAVSTYAAPAKEQTIEKLMQISDIQGVLQQTNQELKPMFDAQAQVILKDALKVKTLDEKQQLAAAQISDLMSNMTNEITKDPKFYEMIKTNFKNTFTEEEAQANIQFLQTPLGQSINQKTAKLMTDLMQQSQSLAEQIFQDPEKKDRFVQSMNEILQPLVEKKASN